MSIQEMDTWKKRCCGGVFDLWDVCGGASRFGGGNFATIEFRNGLGVWRKTLGNGELYKGRLWLGLRAWWLA